MNLLLTDSDIHLDSEDWLPAGLRLVSQLGQGGFASVYLVQRIEDNRYFALKRILRADFSTDNQRAVNRILDERSALSASSGDRLHAPTPYLLTLQNYFERPDSVCLLMDFMQGGDMFNLLQLVGCFEEDQAAFYLAEMATAIRELHGRGYIHRDLKPRNWLIDLSGHLCLADFGLVKNARSSGNPRNSLGSSHRHLATPNLPVPPSYPPRSVARSFVSPALPPPSTLGPASYQCGTLGPAFAILDDPAFARSLVGTTIYMAPEVALAGWALAGSWEGEGCGVPDPNEDVDVIHTLLRDHDNNSAEADRLTINPAVLLGINDDHEVDIRTMLEGYGRSCDFWALGCLLYELLTGEPPFTAKSPEELLERLSESGVAPPARPMGCSDDCWDLLCALIAPLSRRLCSTARILAHPFFRTNGLADVVGSADRLRASTPPWVPRVSGPEDLTHFASFTSVIGSLPPPRFQSPGDSFLEESDPTWDWASASRTSQPNFGFASPDTADRLRRIEKLGNGLY